MKPCARVCKTSYFSATNHHHHIQAFLQDCKRIKGLKEGRELHLRAIFHGFSHVSLLGDHLIRMFASCGSLYEASLSFHQVEETSIYTWHAFVSAHVLLNEDHMALHTYQKMLLHHYHREEEGEVSPGRVTFLCILKACGNVLDAFQGMSVHHQIVYSGFESDKAIESCLIDMYMKCQNVDNAYSVLTSAEKPNVASYNAFMSGCIDNQLFFLAIQCFWKMPTKPNIITYCSILKACNEIQDVCQGRCVHRNIVDDGFDTDSNLAGSLVRMYSNFGWIEEAIYVFQHASERKLCLWNALMAGYVHNDAGMFAISLYKQMQSECIRPDNVTFSSITKACGMANQLHIGMYIHDQIVKSRLEQDSGVANMLIYMYMNCGILDEAMKVFDGLSDRDVVSWGAIISGYIQHGRGALALEMFERMIQGNNLHPDKSLILSVLKTCGMTGDLGKAKLLHKYIIQKNIEIDLMIGSALMDMYAKCGTLENVCTVFTEMKEPDVVLYNSLIAAYVQEGYHFSIIEVLANMYLVGTKPDKTTFSCVLKGCGNSGAIEQGKLVHHNLAWSHISSDIILGNTLIDMYAKCGALEDARNILDSLPDQNVGSWGAMISGYAQYGEHILAKQCFIEMQSCRDIEPDDKMLTSILSSCGHANQIEEGLGYFKCMETRYGITPSNEHYNCMIDLFASGGRLKEAGKLLEEMPFEPDITGWMSLLAACRRYGNISHGRWCFDQIFRRDSSVSAAYIIMSNIFSDANLLDDFKKIEELRNKEGTLKNPGKAWIEVNNKMFRFVVGDKCHYDQVYMSEKIKRLKGLSVKYQGYLPHLDLFFEHAIQTACIET